MEFEIYSSGLCHCSVCTTLTDEDATRRVNREMPTGVGPWMIREAAFRTGQVNGVSCDRQPETHRHILFTC